MSEKFIEPLFIRIPKKCDIIDGIIIGAINYFNSNKITDPTEIMARITMVGLVSKNKYLKSIDRLIRKGFIDQEKNLIYKINEKESFPVCVPSLYIWGVLQGTTFSLVKEALDKNKGAMLRSEVASVITEANYYANPYRFIGYMLKQEIFMYHIISGMIYLSDNWVETMYKQIQKEGMSIEYVNLPIYKIPQNQLKAIANRRPPTKVLARLVNTDTQSTCRRKSVKIEKNQGLEKLTENENSVGENDEIEKNQGLEGLTKNENSVEKPHARARAHAREKIIYNNIILKKKKEKKEKKHTCAHVREENFLDPETSLIRSVSPPLPPQAPCPPAAVGAAGETQPEVEAGEARPEVELEKNSPLTSSKRVVIFGARNQTTTEAKRAFHDSRNQDTQHPASNTQRPSLDAMQLRTSALEATAKTYSWLNTAKGVTATRLFSKLRELCEENKLYAPTHMTVLEERQLKSLIKFCKNEGIDPVEFLKFCFANWGQIHDAIRWPNSGNPRLLAYPNLQEIVYAKKDIIALTKGQEKSKPQSCIEKTQEGKAKWI